MGDFTFAYASAFNGDLSKWNVGSVTSLRGMFYQATSLNGDISEWDVRSATTMQIMFQDATSFNIDISKWDVRKALDVSYMFNGASSFYQTLCGHWLTKKASLDARSLYTTNMFTGSKGKIAECSDPTTTTAAKTTTAAPVYITVSTTCGCETNSGVTRSGAWSSTKSIGDCQQKCNQQSGCVAVDYLASDGWCNWYSEVCSKPQHDCGQGWSTYRKSDGTQSNTPVYITVSTTCACETNSGVTRSGAWSSTKSIDDCQQKCNQQSGCVAVDYLASDGWCNWYSEVC